MHCTKDEKTDKVTDTPKQPCNETGKLCLRERNVCTPMVSSLSPLQTLDVTARALCFGLSTDIASEEWYLPWLSLMRLSAIQASTIGDSGVIMSLLHLQTGSNLGSMLSRSDRLLSLQGVFTDAQSPSNTEKEQLTLSVEECVQDESDCKPQCIITSPASSLVPPTVVPSPVSNLQVSPPTPPPLPSLVPAPHHSTLPISCFYSNKSTFIAKHTPSLFHPIEPLDAFSVRALLRQRVGEKRKETIVELNQQESSDSSICPQNKKAKLDETYLTELIEEDRNVQIVPTAKINTLKHDTESQDSTEKYTPDQCPSNQTTRTIESPKNEVDRSYEQWSSSDDPIPLLDSSFQSDSFHQVPGSPSNYSTEELQVAEELFPPVADDVTKSKCTQGANSSLFQNLDYDQEDHTVPSQLSVSDLYRERLYLKKAYNNFNEPLEPTRLNLTKPRLRLGLSKKQRCRALHNAPL